MFKESSKEEDTQGVSYGGIDSLEFVIQTIGSCWNLTREQTQSNMLIKWNYIKSRDHVFLHVSDQKLLGA